MCIVPNGRNKSRGRLPIPFLYCSLQLALRFFLFYRVTLIIGLFPLGETDEDLCLAPNKIDLERDKGKTLHRHLADKLPYLFSVEQELACTERLVVHDIAVRIGTDVRVEEEHLVVLHDSITVGKIC